MGYLLISGLVEPVVRAYSLITDLVEKYEGTQSRTTEPGERGSGETLDLRREFKALVERWEDRHILDLLVLPWAVKEVLLDLVKESGLGMNPRMATVAGNERGGSMAYPEGKWEKTTRQWDEGMAMGSNRDPAVKDMSAGLQGRAESSEERLLPQELGDQDQPEQVVTVGPEVTEEPGQEGDQELQFLLLLKFFTAMGYTEDVVKRVLAKTGPKEASQVLDLVQQEQDRTDREQAAQATGDVVTPGQRERNRPCESEHRDDGETVAGADISKLENGEIRDGEEGGAKGNRRHLQTEASGARGEEAEHEEDFVLRVLKKAAVSCGYTEQKVTQVYNMFPGRSTHQLLLELQRDDKKEAPDTFWEGPRETEDVVVETGGPDLRPTEARVSEIETLVPSEEREPVDQAWPAAQKKHTDPENVFDWNDKGDQFTVNQYTSKKTLQSPHQHTLPVVKGPPMTTYSSSLDPTHTTSTQHQHNKPRPVNKTAQSSSSLKEALQAPLSSVQPGKDSVTPRAKARRELVVTREQRFLEGLQTPFKLTLTDKPGDPKLREVIIDGSNIAMRWVGPNLQTGSLLAGFVVKGG